MTVVVSDLQGSTALAERLDPESLRDVLDQYFDELGRVLESYGGRIEKRIGDAMVTVFGLPVAGETDALRAVQAVAECQATLANLNDRIERTWGVRLTNRTGVSTGDVVFAEAGGGHRVMAGSALLLASALEPVAPPLEALLAATTVEAVGSAVAIEPPSSVTLKDGSTTMAARLLGVATPTSAIERGDEPAAGRCASCGTAVDVDADPSWSWCPQCGDPVASRGPRQASRRTLTIVFADLSPRSSSSDDPEARRTATVRAFEELRGVLEHHGGIVEKFIGDAVMAVFGLAQRHEDDALRAVRAALDMQSALERIAPALDAEFGVQLGLRIGVNTGPVIAGDPSLGQRLVTGDAVNVAARLEQTAGPGEVVIGSLTSRLVGEAAVLEPLPPLTLKGKAEPVPASRVLRVVSGPSVRARLELPLVGRDRELDAMQDRFQEAVRTLACRRMTIRGDAGIGKSRLVYEMIDRLPGTVRVLRGTCPSYGEGITFWPVVELIQAASGTSPSDPGETARAAIAALLPDGDPAVERLWSIAGLTERQFQVPELVWAVRRLIGHLAATGPLVVVIDGLHWAEPTLLELLDDLDQNLRDAPVLVVTMERPPETGAAVEPTDVRPEDGAGLLSWAPSRMARTTRSSRRPSVTPRCHQRSWPASSRRRPGTRSSSNSS